MITFVEMFAVAVDFAIGGTHELIARHNNIDK